MNKNHNSHVSLQGFTLIELMVVIAIIAILVAVAAPSFVTTMAQNSINGGISTLSTDLNFARSEAFKRGLTVAVCPTNADFDGCQNTGNWENGWIVFLDRNANNSRSSVVANAETILRVQQALPGDLNIVGSSSSTVKSVSFDRSGTSSTVGIEVNSNKLGTSGQLDTVRALCVALAGRVRITPIKTSTC